MSAELKQAREALKARNPRLAADLASRVLQDRPDEAAAFLVRAQAHFMAKNFFKGFGDLLDGMALTPMAPELAARFEAQLMMRLDHAVDYNWAALEALSHAGLDRRRFPQAAQATQLVSAVIAADLERARRIVGDAGNALPVATARLASRLLIADRRIDQAISVLSEALQAAKRPADSDEDLVAMAAFRRELAQGMRDGKTFPPRYRLALCAALKDEADNLAEWVAYHAEIGVEAFYLYDNDSSDGTAGILDSLSRRYRIIRYRISQQPAQALAYKHFLQVHRYDAAWAALIDGDEFINPLAGPDLHGHLQQHEDCAGIAINWAVFGSSGHQAKPPGLCIESFTRRAADGHPAHSFVKTIIRPTQVVSYLGPHHQMLHGRHVDAMGAEVLPLASRVRMPVAPALRVNHYAVKSQEQARRKLKRGAPYPESSPNKYRDESYVAWYDCNDLEDLSITRFAPQVHRALQTGDV